MNLTQTSHKTPRQQRSEQWQQLERSVRSLDAVCELLDAANGERISSVSLLLLLKPLQERMVSVCDELRCDEVH